MISPYKNLLKLILQNCVTNSAYSKIHDVSIDMNADI